MATGTKKKSTAKRTTAKKGTTRKAPKAAAKAPERKVAQQPPTLLARGIKRVRKDANGVPRTRRSRYASNADFLKAYPDITRKAKVCPGCKVDKQAVEFGRHARQSDGLQTWCLDCRVSQKKQAASA